MARNIESKEWQDGELVESNETVTVNGRVPGEGGSGYWEESDGALTPADGQPVNVDYLCNSHISCLPRNCQESYWGGVSVSIIGVIFDPSGSGRLTIRAFIIIDF